MTGPGILGYGEQPIVDQRTGQARQAQALAQEGATLLDQIGCKPVIPE